MSSREGWDRLYSGDSRPWKGESQDLLEIDGAVLELGIGNGKGLSLFSGNATPIGLDFSRQALLSCREWHSIPLVLGDVTALPFRDACFPFISASHVLGHLLTEERKRAAAEIVRVLSLDGKVFVNVFGEEDMRCGSGREVEERTYERGNGIICHYFLENEMDELFPSLRVERSWERRVHKRFHGQDEVRQERRIIYQ
ncbi:MAG: class I SAM-dependent methyltransferase [Methanomassiliicoccales archaeon]|nr:class I SAM-dependent methyltransferase [Methanomassiliicoccales archaeon]